MALAAGTRLGPYQIDALIGAGGMGEVYRATDTRLDRTVAVKVLPAHLAANPEFKQRLEREARAVASLNHPHICALFDIGHQDGIDYLVLEYLEGETLTARLNKGPLPAEQVVRYGVEICDALDKAHRKGFTHRDLKPGNIMLTDSGAKLLDFGLAKPGLARSSDATAAASPTVSVGLTAAGSILGTVQYMAPEQLQGKDADARSDLFALGAVLYEMATGRKAFTGDNQATLIAAIMTSEPQPISTIAPGGNITPPSLTRLIKRCLAKDPENRWQNARDLMLELKSVSDREEVAAAPAVSRPSQRGWMAVTAVLSVIAATLGIAYFRSARAGPETGTAVLKLSLLPPEKTNFHSFAISPDGRWLAFAAADEMAKTQLWVRPVDSLAAQALGGAEGASYPFWSPDSRHIGFFAQGKLKRIDVSGGPPQVLCDAGVARGGAWNRDGVIVFSPGNSGVRRVPAAGGEPRPLTALDSSRQEDSHRWPFFLPDGRHFFYVARSPKAENNAIYVRSLESQPDSKDQTRLLAVNSRVAYAASPSGPGHLLFVRDGTLLALPFDAKKRQAAGEAVPLVEQVGFASGTSEGAFSISQNGMLVYDPRGDLRSTQLTWFDREGKRLGTIGGTGSYLQPWLSPDEKRVAVENMDPSTRSWDIWLLDLARGISSRFTFDPRLDVFPVWSPDGGSIVFASQRAGPEDLYLKSSSGAAGDEMLWKSSEGKWPNDWSLDGRFIVYQERHHQTKWDLWALPMEGPEGAGALGARKPIPVLRTEFDEQHGQISPQGKWIAYTSDESGRNEVYAQSFGGTPSAPGGKWQISNSGGSRPKWRRDGKELFYLGLDRKLMAVEAKTAVVKGQTTLEAGAPRALFDTRVSIFVGIPYTVTTDGQRFLIVTQVEDQGSSPLALVFNWPATLRR